MPAKHVCTYNIINIHLRKQNISSFQLSDIWSGNKVYAAYFENPFPLLTLSYMSLIEPLCFCNTFRKSEGTWDWEGDVYDKVSWKTRKKEMVGIIKIHCILLWNFQRINRNDIKNWENMQIIWQSSHYTHIYFKATWVGNHQDCRSYTLLSLLKPRTSKENLEVK